MPAALSAEELDALLRDLPEWSLAEGKLHREFAFADFVAAFGFMARAALVAERMNHHPEWSNVWNRVVVDLVTHDSGGITASDLALARKMESFASG